MIQDAPPPKVEGVARHRESDLVKRFLLGEVNPEENRAVVRHLLGRCEACLQETRRFWEESGEDL
ncbi:MAG: hypothetical protein ACJ75H_09910 [Thermoanaerobaculia bacterium]